MGGARSRNKGARGEREVIRMLQPIVDTVCDDCGVGRIVLQRNLLQAHSGGHDLFGLEWLSLEVKRQERENVGKWWRQTLRQAQSWQTPVLIYRSNYQPWKVRMVARVRVGRKHIRMPVDISLKAFLLYFRERMKVEVAR
jgi:hypothetical protein